MGRLNKRGTRTITGMLGHVLKNKAGFVGQDAAAGVCNSDKNPPTNRQELALAHL